MACGRATNDVLNFNSRRRVELRELLILDGDFGPSKPTGRKGMETRRRRIDIALSMQPRPLFLPFPAFT
jgi:hypothetical protein